MRTRWPVVASFLQHHSQKILADDTDSRAHGCKICLRTQFHMLSRVGRQGNLYPLVHKLPCSPLGAAKSFSTLGIVAKIDNGGQRKRLWLMLGFVRRMHPDRKEDSSRTVSIPPCFPSTSPVFGYSSESAESDNAFSVNIQKLVSNSGICHQNCYCPLH